MEGHGLGRGHLYRHCHGVGARTFGNCLRRKQLPHDFDKLDHQRARRDARRRTNQYSNAECLRRATPPDYRHREGYAGGRSTPRVCALLYHQRRGPGTGMGLAMVYGIVKRQSGSVDIQSQAGKGTTIAMPRPLTATDPSGVTGDTSLLQAGRPPTYQIDVLAVDGEPLIRDFLFRILTRDGNTVMTALNGREAVEVLGQAKFDLVITDRGMPEMGGNQLAVSIKRDFGDIPNIMLTGFGELIKLSGEFSPRVDLILSKPATIGSLREAINMVYSSRPASAR